MELKEKCIYYNPSKESCYLVLSVSNMIYGRYGDMANPSYLDSYMNQDGTGLRFMIDDIIINSDYIRNYSLNDKALDEFKLIKELTDEEFYLMELLIHSCYSKYPAVVIDVPKHINDASDIIKTLQHKKSEKEELEKEIHGLEKQLFVSIK